ncbi:MAG: hypothetical protein SNF33_00565 [Candidatus Algichlamydia australiensis]|nr:hypothetical protein [Chlamydiales bacterium]
MGKSFAKLGFDRYHVELSGNEMNNQHFFSGSHESKLDEKGRFVLPQAMRYGLVEEGKLEFVIGLGLGGCLAIYRKSEIASLVEKFRAKMHIAKFQKFFTIFFSTLHHTTCDKVGRVGIPPILKKAIGFDKEIVVAGVLDKIELWPKEKYMSELEDFLGGENPQELLKDLLDESFAQLNEKEDAPKEEELLPL